MRTMRLFSDNNFKPKTRLGLCALCASVAKHPEFVPFLRPLSFFAANKVCGLPASCHPWFKNQESAISFQLLSL